MIYNFKRIKDFPEHVQGSCYAITENGHTMFPEDVLQKLDRLNYLLEEKDSNFVNPLLGEGWQDIRIKLPDNEQIVLIAESDETIKKGYYIEEEKQWYYLLDNEYYNTTEDVCFWLNIPDLPSFT